MIFHISPLLSMGPFLWAWHPISTAAVVQCPPIAGNELKRNSAHVLEEFYDLLKDGK